MQERRKILNALPADATPDQKLDAIIESLKIGYGGRGGYDQRRADRDARRAAREANREKRKEERADRNAKIFAKLDAIQASLNTLLKKSSPTPPKQSNKGRRRNR